MRRLHLLTVVAIAAVARAGIGCGGPLAEAESLFDAGRYAPAKQRFALLEEASSRWDEATRAEYELYRGLTLAALGDWSRAGRWLARAKAIEDLHRGSLSRSDARRLQIALESRP